MSGIRAFASRLTGACVLGLALVCCAPATARQSNSASATSANKPAFKPEELDQMLAPLALYPDSLLSQALMASTYPLEIVEADRWAQEHKSLKGDALATALEAQSWDPSVKSLINFPAVLSMLSDKLDWTTKLGDAMIGQQKDVMAAVQRLRAKVQAQGQLKSSAQQNVQVEQQGASQVIVIQPPNPDVIYIPSYNPAIVYGAWPYPAYPPYPYYPPGYAATAAVSFGVGVACGMAWGYAWGSCNWGHGNVDVNVNQNYNRNTNINRSNYTNVGHGNGAWQHDPAHRDGVPYRNSAEAQKFGGMSAGQATQARDSFRGRENSGGEFGRSGGFGRGSDGFGGGWGDSGRSFGGGSFGSRESAFGGSREGGDFARESSDRGWGSRGGGGGWGGGGGRRFGGGGGFRRR